MIEAKMKKNLIMLLMTGLLALSMHAIPADPTPMPVTQPDGTTVTIKLHGDEFFHVTTTLDGYTVLKNAAGYYTYARQQADGSLVPGDLIARDAANRTAADRAFLARTPKGLTDKANAANGTKKLGRRNAAMRRVGSDGMMDYERFRGLIILINYTDKKFSMPEVNAFYDDMVNTPNFTGYTLNGRRVNMPGSVRDYFYDNSYHIFDPTFDVVGPVDVNYKCTDPRGTDGAEPIFYAALNAADSLVNYNDYDTDGDGYVDMVFFLVAGLSANYGGNNSNYLWPHMYYLYRAPRLDGVGFGLYACSTEIAGWESYYRDVNGIGTFCHEFGHVLGLPDLYDTDYEQGGGQSRDPGEWSIMAGGSGNNFGRDPVGYSLYERYALGFTEPILITEPGELSIQPLDESNTGYRLDTKREHEFFLIENRQDKGKWDRYLPGHGMLVAHVDSTNARIWDYNEVNCNPSHMCYDLLRASYKGRDSDSDPYPGTDMVTSLNNFTNPNLMSWDRKFSDLVFNDIAENNGIITLTVDMDTSIVSIIEDFELMPATDDMSAKGVQGVYSKWDFSKCAIQTLDDGTKAVAMKKPSQITTSTPMRIKPYMVQYTITNPTATEAKFVFYYSLDKGKTWTSSVEGQVSVSGGNFTNVAVTLPTTAPIMMRISQTAGNAKSPCYLDDVQLYYDEFWPEPITGDLNEDQLVNISDLNQMIDYVLKGSVDAYTMELADLNHDGQINISDINLLINIIVR